MKFISVTTIWMLLNAATIAFAHGPGAHVHGQGKLVIALESPTKAKMSFESPTDSIFGFEHEAKSSKDKKTKQDALEKMRNNSDAIVVFEPALNCKTVSTRLEVKQESDDDENEHHGHHQNIEAEFETNCQKSVVGSFVTVGLVKLFPKLKKVKVQILSESKQNEIEIQNAKDKVAL